ncbi:hypothetical protein JCM18916_2839 [Cutibacterium acnes JCM 18916]|nr:hypothetical protein JCM18916_2839 [Cutibacterium acnes JCM 18916]
MQYPGDGQPQGQLQQWNGQLYQGDPYAQPPYQDPRQQEPGQLWGNQPLGHVSGGATSASQTGQNPIPNQARSRVSSPRQTLMTSGRTTALTEVADFCRGISGTPVA